MKLSKLTLLVLYIAISSFAYAQSKASQTKKDKGSIGERQKILGSWKLQEIQYQYTDTTYIVNDEDHGRFIFTDSNYVLIYNPRMQKRKAFDNLSKPTIEEISTAFRSIVFNTGIYAIEDSVITTTADIAKVPGFEGGRQYYKLAFTNKGLELVMYDETYPNGNKPEWFGKLKIKFILKKE
ncbi:lipocalin-like domain-containing protein [Winogradskyella flava]|uniref:lipocalin-like domain-containing protein n=1 Tax=Winogradskyella flava TaxID=1884876 RepID=UPI002492C8B4|nr:lipocalin-like domain-containing protein [Winogradskyella flava]